MAVRERPMMHLVMVPNPPFHPRGDFALAATACCDCPMMAGAMPRRR